MLLSAERYDRWPAPRCRLSGPYRWRGSFSPWREEAPPPPPRRIGPPPSPASDGEAVSDRPENQTLRPLVDHNLQHSTLVRGAAREINQPPDDPARSPVRRERTSAGAGARLPESKGCVLWWWTDAAVGATRLLRARLQAERGPWCGSWRIAASWEVGGDTNAPVWEMGGGRGKVYRDTNAPGHRGKVLMLDHLDDPNASPDIVKI